MTRQILVRWTMLALIGAAFLSASPMAAEGRPHQGRSLAGKIASPRLKGAVQQAAKEYSQPQLRGVESAAKQDEHSDLRIRSYGFVRKHPYEHPSYVHPAFLPRDL